MDISYSRAWLELTRSRGRLKIGVGEALMRSPHAENPTALCAWVSSGSGWTDPSETKSFSQLSRDVGVSDQTLRNWVRQADVDAGRRHDGLTSTQREELRRLRAENRTLRMERDVLKKRRSSSPGTAIGVGERAGHL
jgi:Transposase